MRLCSECGTEATDAAGAWRCACGGPWTLPLGPGLTREQVIADEPSLWRYAPALPVDRADVVASFGEGRTPLVSRPWGGRSVDFKLDHLFPSGSYKDRGSAVLVNALHHAGVRRVHEDSSGNAGASLATYAAPAGLECTIYVPASTSAGKRVQIAAHGAAVRPIEGPREASSRAAVEAAESGVSHYASHNWDPLFVEGVKTVAYELWEQYGYGAPDVVFAPLGYGSVVLGLARGFAELLQAGAIERLPRIVGCQAAACAPIERAYRSGDRERVHLHDSEVRPTVAEGIAASRPMRAGEVMQWLDRCRGTVLAVGEEEVLAAWHRLAALGFYVEPTSAVAPAAALAASELMGPGVGRVAIVLTGSGLKATDTLARIMAAPPD